MSFIPDRKDIFACQPDVEEAQAELRKKMFFDILRIRRVEEAISKRYGEQEMRCPTHFCVGQEAVAVGISANLTKRDYVMSAHRAHAHYLACGGSLDRFIAELYGKASGCAGGRGGSMHLLDKDAGFLGCVPIVGSTISIATGVAFQNAREGNDRVVVVYLGDGATEEGVFYESLNFAKFWKLPILYACENNTLSVVTSYDKRRPEEQKIVDIVRSLNIDTCETNGQDCDKVYHDAKILIEKLRAGKGPQFIELSTDRLVEHCGPFIFDKVAEGKTDPLDFYKQRLISEKIITEEDSIAFEATIDKELDRAFEKAKSDKFPERKDLFSGIYYGGME